MKTLFCLVVLAAAVDVTPEPPVLAGLPLWAQTALVAGVTAAIGYLWSVFVSFFSNHVRRLGKGAKPWMLSLSAALNATAGNPHKAVRAAAAAKEKAE